MTNPSRIRPLLTQILIRPEQVEQVTASGIQIMSDKELDRLELAQQDGIVVALGAGVEDIEFSVGSRVFFKKYAGVALDGKDGLRYRLVERADVIGLYEEE